MDYIKLEDCRNDYLYQIDGRNGDVAIYRDERFYLARYEFGMTDLDNEIHYDSDIRYGTVKPIRCLGYVGRLNDDEMLELLKDK